MTYQLDSSSASSSSEPGFRTLFELISSPFIDSLTDIGYLQSASLIEYLSFALSQIPQSSSSPPSPLSSSTLHGLTLSRIQFKYQTFKQFLTSTSPSVSQQSIPQSGRGIERKGSRHDFPSGDWTIAEFFLCLPIVFIRFSLTPQFGFTLRHMIRSLSGPLGGCVTAGCVLLGRLLERCSVKKCQPIVAMQSSLLVPSEELGSSSILERQLLESVLTEDFYLSLIEIYETLSAHPSYPPSLSPTPTIKPTTSSKEDQPSPLPKSAVVSKEEFYELRSILILELIQHNNSGEYSLLRPLRKLTTKQQQLWMECQSFCSSSSLPQDPDPPPTVQNRLLETLRDLSSQSQSSLGTVLCLLFILKSSQTFEEAVQLNLQIGGEVHLRSPLCGAFYSLSTYPLSSHDHHWSRQAMPPKWIQRSLPEIKLKNVTDVMRKVCSTSHLVLSSHISLSVCLSLSLSLSLCLSLSMSLSVDLFTLLQLMSPRQQVLVIGAANDKIGLKTLEYLCDQSLSLITPVVGLKNPLENDETISALCEGSNLLVKEVDFSSSESILKSIEQVPLSLFLSLCLSVSLSL
jgi:hypothetical protein